MPVEKYLRTVTLALENRVSIWSWTLQPDLRANLPLDRGFGNMGHRRRNTQLFELASKNLRDLRIVQTRRHSSIYTDKTTSKIHLILLVSINPTVNLSKNGLRRPE